MRQHAVTLEDEEAAKPKVAARVRRIDSTNSTNADLLKLLTAIKTPRWRGGLSARKKRAAIKAARAVALAPPPMVFTVHLKRTGTTKSIRYKIAQEVLESASPLVVRTSAIVDEAEFTDRVAKAAELQNFQEQIARTRRLAALMPSQGIWKNDTDKPQDGVEYENEVRAEWQ